MFSKPERFTIRSTDLRSKISGFLKKNGKIICYSLLFTVVITGALLRIDRFASGNDYQWQSDYNRDYSIADHIIRYDEKPSVGPESFLGPETNSPFYYYFLSWVLLIKNDIVFLGYFNVALQISVILLIYSLARVLFGRGTGLVAAILWSLSGSVIAQSGYVWQPHIMQPFAILSYLLLALGYAEKKYSLILSSIAMFAVALVMHNSMLAIAPAFLMAILLVLWLEKKTLKHYLGIILTAAVSLMILYIPLISYYWSNPAKNPLYLWLILGQIMENKYVIVVFWERLEIFFNFLFPSNNPYIDLSVVTAMIAVSVWYFKSKTAKTNRIKLLTITAAVMSFMTIIWFITWTPAVAIPFPYRHFTPIFCLFIMIASEFIATAMRSGFPGKVIGVVILILLVSGASPDLKVSAQAAIKNIGYNAQGLVGLKYIEDDPVRAMAEAISKIEKEEGRPNLNFFQIRFYRDNVEDQYFSETLWTPLERITGEKLIKTDGHSYRGYSPLGTDEYIFLGCRYINLEKDDECIKIFNEEGNYKIVDLAYSSVRYDIYLLRRQ